MRLKARVEQLEREVADLNKEVADLAKRSLDLKIEVEKQRHADRLQAMSATLDAGCSTSAPDPPLTIEIGRHQVRVVDVVKLLADAHKVVLIDAHLEATVGNNSIVEGAPLKGNLW